jgi:hypothetical protein
MEAGKLTPAQAAWATEYAEKDPQGFAAFAQGAPQVVILGEIGSGAPPANDVQTFITAQTDAGKSLVEAYELAYGRFSRDKVDEVRFKKG